MTFWSTVGANVVGYSISMAILIACGTCAVMMMKGPSDDMFG